jgi:hypothetical protein
VQESLPPKDTKAVQPEIFVQTLETSWKPDGQTHFPFENVNPPKQVSQ